MSTPYSPSRSPRIPRMQLGATPSRLRSCSLKKPPEPLHRAFADCLSAAVPSSQEASRTLRDYLASHVTVDLAYAVILDHTLAERERSPAVVARCVALLKRYLLRYKPNEETLLQIDRFCISIITECEVGPHRNSIPCSSSFSQQYGIHVQLANGNSSTVPSFASAALVKSLNYIRSLVSQYVPKRSFQPAAFAGAAPASRQSLPALSSLLSRSFSYQLKPSNVKESMESKDLAIPSVSDSTIPEDVEEFGNSEFLPLDVFRWRWCTDQQSSLLQKGDHITLHEVHSHNFLEVGAAALLLSDMENKTKGASWKLFGSRDMAYLDQLLQPSLLTTVTNSTSAFAHLRAITTIKRSKPGADQIWNDSATNTFRPRARPLFQYRHYSEQQPLRLNPVEVSEVIAVVCSETSSATCGHSTVSGFRHGGRPTMDVAASVLVKLVIDMYVLDSQIAAPLTLSLLEDMLNSPCVTSRTRAFDLIINLGVHAHLLEPPSPDVSGSLDEQYSQEAYFETESKVSEHRPTKVDFLEKEIFSSAIEKFESWIMSILFEILLHLVQIEEKEETVWASSLSCLLYFVCNRGRIRHSRLVGLDIRVIKVLMQISRRNCWAEVVHCKLISMMTYMFYQVLEEHANIVPSSPLFLVGQVDLIGGIDFIFEELVLSSSRKERRNLYLVLFDYVIHKINETCIATGISEYSDDEVRPIATLLLLADAPEALYISVKLGVDGILELLRRSISNSVSTYPDNDRLSMLLEKIVEMFDMLIGSFTHVDSEFTQMIQITKMFKSFESLSEVPANISSNANISWTVLHSLLHSERKAYRHNGYLWLGDLLVAEISGNGDMSLSASIKNLEQKISHAGVNEYSESFDVPLAAWFMCGLLRSKNNNIRLGFLLVLERLLMRFKFLLDENEAQKATHGQPAIEIPERNHLEKASVVIDVMSCALSLMAQINETDRMNILKMCDILLSQLCLKVGKTMQVDSGNSDRKTNLDPETHIFQRENVHLCDFLGDPNAKRKKRSHVPVHDTSSMAALLLHGQAVVPMQLVARVPTALFYWPLIQLASAATDNIALGVSVGSKGRGNLPGGTSDIRATLLLLLIGKCTADPGAFKEVGGEEFFRELLDDTDARVAYYSSTFLLKRMMMEDPESYQRMLHNLVSRAQQSNNEKLLENPYLQMRGLLQLSNE